MAVASSTAGAPRSCGTLTLKSLRVPFPDESPTRSVTDYTRLFFFPSRSERSRTDLQSPAITMSLIVVPSALRDASSGSSLVTFSITTLLKRFPSESSLTLCTV